MNFKLLKSETWENLDRSGDSITGYHSMFLSLKDDEPSNLHIFVDENGKYHFAISDTSAKGIPDPKVNGLTVKLMKYRLNKSEDQTFIDLSCTINAYVEEFTEIVKEISEKILIEKLSSETAVNDVITNWKAFWGKRPKEILSDEEQVGLLCELKVLQILCRKEPAWALDTWKGPLGEKYDFVLSNQVLEVKGTRSDNRIHTINGIDQLMKPKDKKLLFISYLVSKTRNESSLCLPDLVDEIETLVLNNHASKILKFRKLLAGTGYSPIHKDKYENCRFDIYDGVLFEVNQDFPKLTNNDLAHP